MELNPTYPDVPHIVLRPRQDVVTYFRTMCVSDVSDIDFHPGKLFRRLLLCVLVHPVGFHHQLRKLISHVTKYFLNILRFIFPEVFRYN